MFFSFIWRYTTLLPVRDLPSVSVSKRRGLLGVLYFLFLSFICFTRSLGLITKKVSMLYFTTQSGIKTNQKAPMAHRQWSQEQFFFKSRHVTLSIDAILPKNTPLSFLWRTVGDSFLPILSHQRNSLASSFSNSVLVADSVSLLRSKKISLFI